MGRIVLVSNRVAVPRSGAEVHAGGLEVALRTLLARHRCVWVGWSGTVVDNGVPKIEHRKVNGTEYAVTDLPRQDYEEYYNGFANRVLWPVLHYRQDLAEFTRRDMSGYLRVNDRFADLLADNLEDDDILWVHDYHLMPLAKILRERGIRNRIGFFLHIPMPPPEVIAAMPQHQRVIGALTEYDLVGFQTETDTANFARYVAKQTGTSPHIGFGGMPRTRVGTFPVGIEAREFHAAAALGAEMEIVETLKKRSSHLIIGVDRLDYSKGLDLKLEAYRRFLKANPEWCGKVQLLQITPKSRSEIAEYSDMQAKLDTISGQINSDFGDVLWSPLRYVTRSYPRNFLAGLYHAARVGLVTPLRDGMNLVGKEYVAAQPFEDPGVLVLSEFAGAAEELKDALLVNPNDPEAVSGAISKALTMPLEERKQRHRRLWAALTRTEIANWGQSFIDKLLSVPPVAGAPENHSRIAAE
jgi:trehalose 6-phosphate synthase